MKFLPSIIFVLSPITLTGCQIETSAIGPEEFFVNDSGTASTSVTLYWSTPHERANGELMTMSDIGGYEIRYKTDAEATYQTVQLNDPAVSQYVIDGLTDATQYQFEVAVYDADGIYSDFVVAAAN